MSFKYSHNNLMLIFLLSLSLSQLDPRNILDREEITSIKYYGKKLTNQKDLECSPKNYNNHPDWLASVSGSKFIHELSLPGTHETCARIGGPGVACQDLSVYDQLVFGVRFLDIRCRHINDCFMIHHDSVYQELSFGSGVRDACIQFLKEHPNEFIYMSVKEEYTAAENTRHFSETMQSYIIDEYFYLKEGTPTLDEVRGKIVLMRRYDTVVNPQGNKVNFQNDATFTSTTTIVARIQDCYYVGTIFDRSRKWSNVNNLLTEARANTDKEKLFMNFASGCSIFCYPYSTAQYITPLVGNYLESNPKVFTGCILFDYINANYGDIVAVMITRNE
ncbi:phosphatidylinositol diacylglycerol-lyase [Tritrichomonas foetus]|uniref:Phosphatidylinositol diacylglycerol-lyase n=1 Tax=Tritrichomonas foetus TaxID=1144522 RepID=A0A1J4JNI4_9EUKA|nr:phosphatidylinositol diacylglycerol-lyase [Tritrichomonas foetus]|eukprot:OHS99999.1 phosphatidylinositol diacylglycerol-lyase [Tritrichomonas foetus]